MEVEYLIKTEKRYIVIRNTQDGQSGTGESYGEFESDVKARNAALAFADQETRNAQPPAKVTRHDGVEWDRASGQWSDCPVEE